MEHGSEFRVRNICFKTPRELAEQFHQKEICNYFNRKIDSVELMKKKLEDRVKNVVKKNAVIRIQRFYRNRKILKLIIDRDKRV